MRNVAAGNLDPLRTRRRPGRVCVSLRFVFQHFTVHSTHHVWTHIPIDLGIAFDSIVYVFICRPASKKVVLPKQDSRSHMFPFLSGDFMKSFMHGILFGAPWLII